MIGRFILMMLNLLEDLMMYLIYTPVAQVLCFLETATQFLDARFIYSSKDVLNLFYYLIYRPKSTHFK
jgi:hypothetical protein